MVTMNVPRVYSPELLETILHRAGSRVGRTIAAGWSVEDRDLTLEIGEWSWSRASVTKDLPTAMVRGTIEIRSNAGVRLAIECLVLVQLWGPMHTAVQEWSHSRIN